MIVFLALGEWIDQNGGKMCKRPKECTLMKIIGNKYLKGSESS